VSDFTALGDGRYVVLERDNFENTEARHKKAFVTELGKTGPGGFLVKREVLDLLDVRDPALISLRDDRGGPPRRQGPAGDSQ
jgi:glycerophosphoryl diester phosphodiesterase